VRVTILGSGSKGNVTLLEASGAALLVDAGLGPRTLATRMAAAGVSPERVDGVVLTHAHRDHSQHAPAYAERFGCPVYLTSATRRGVRWEKEPTTRVIGHAAPFRVGAFEVRPLPIPHDAPQVALTFEHMERCAGATRPIHEGERVGIVTDLGHVPEALAAHLEGCATLLLESNHDPVLLRDGAYPEPLKRRVAGPLGHLSNEQSAALLERLAGGLAQVVLMHLSEKNNRPALAYAAAKHALRKSGAELLLAHQEVPLQLSSRARQLGFGF
jgi:phosphoribosyl 1,2-cyclic phosphodiesterase